ncbi:MAG: hypothetical protein MZU91_09930 [Desulfosudis oleivorans]|nr:hypothetical protein [Desulfosudis oleivorans]
MPLIKKARCWLPVLPMARRWAFCNRREPAGADFVVGEGQSFGNPLNYGGPYLGIFAAREKFMRRIPGRLVGATVDKNGKRGFVLTLQTREQHIRREKATSNICSNEALCALAAGVYLAALGKNLQQTCRTQYLQNSIFEKQTFSNLRAGRKYFPRLFITNLLLRCPDAQNSQRKTARMRESSAAMNCKKIIRNWKTRCSFAPRKCFPKKIWISVIEIIK